MTRAALVILASTLIAACSGDPEIDGALLASEKGCVACHGPVGQATAGTYPNLHIQWERYLRVQLLKYRSGERENAIMNGFAMTLTDEEIRALAKHYGT